MDDHSIFFTDVADALGIESVAIVEKDHYIVEFLRLLKPLTFTTHQIVFAGGTALAKSGIALNRMSEDVDIKLVPINAFQTLSRTQRKNIRKEIIQNIASTVTATGMFNFDDKYPKVTRDEYRYNAIPVRYPQHFAQVPCLRPFIRLELMESDLLELPEARAIHSLGTALTGREAVVSDFLCTTINSTHAEKVVALLRRTAAVLRNIERFEDTSLVRHIYDTYRIAEAGNINIPVLANFVQRTAEQDIRRYGNQYPQFCTAPNDEMKMGLDELGYNPLYQTHYEEFVAPMIYGGRHVSWDEAYTRFRQVALAILENYKRN